MAPQQPLAAAPARRHAVFTLTPETLGGFDMETYSRFKYGDVEATNHFAGILADALEALFPEGGPERAHLAVAPSAYLALPTAAAVVTQRMLARLSAGGRHVPAALHIGRASHIDKDFSLLTPEQRAAVMGANKLELPPPAALAGRHLVVVDDCRITGAHEECVRQALAAAAAAGGGPASLTFLYIAMVPPELVAAAKSGCAASAGFLKGVEGAMNGAAIKSLSDLAPVLCQRGAVLTARTTKFVLQKAAAEGAPALGAFLAALPPRLMVQLIEGADADGYSSMPALAAPAASLRRAAAELGATAAVAAAAALARRLSGELARRLSGSFTLRAGGSFSAAGDAPGAMLPGERVASLRAASLTRVA